MQERITRWSRRIKVGDVICIDGITITFYKAKDGNRIIMLIEAAESKKITWTKNG